MLRAAQVQIVAALIAKVDQSVMPAGMPLAENCDNPAAANSTKNAL